MEEGEQALKCPSVEPMNECLVVRAAARRRNDGDISLWGRNNGTPRIAKLQFYERRKEVLCKGLIWTDGGATGI